MYDEMETKIKIYFYFLCHYVFCGKTDGQKMGYANQQFVASYVRLINLLFFSKNKNTAFLFQKVEKHSICASKMKSVCLSFSVSEISKRFDLDQNLKYYILLLIHKTIEISILYIFQKYNMFLIICQKDCFNRKTHPFLILLKTNCRHLFASKTSTLVYTRQKTGISYFR